MESGGGQDGQCPGRGLRRPAGSGTEVIMQFRGGAMGGMNEMVRQASRMQRKVEEAKASIKDEEVSVSTAGDKVRAVVTCEGKVKQFVIDPAFLQEEGLEMALDALVAATNAARAAAEKKVEEHVNKATGIKSPVR